MLVSTKGRYALRVMVDLAEHQAAGRIPLKEIAARQGISEKYLDYANSVEEKLKANGIRCSVDSRSEKIGYKIREARLQKTPYMLVVGQKEEEEGVVSVRSRFKGDEGAQSLDTFIDDICKEIRTKEIRKVEVTPESK